MSLEAAWKTLEDEARAGRDARIVDMFALEPQRLAALGVEACGLSLDLSKQSWRLSGFDAALGLARAAGVEGARDRLFAGEAVNSSENRPALHMALRAQAGDGFRPAVMAEVEAMRERMRAFAEGVRSGAITGAGGKRFRSILHIGIGGSDLGPRLIRDALAGPSPSLELRFAANIDPADFARATADLDPAETLVIVVSKTFSTQETMANAERATAWLGKSASAHLAAVSSAPERCAALGIAPERVFPVWDWVGGRYSLWSAVGLSTAVSLGWDAFEGLLAGARAMDQHFRTAPLARNTPIMLALAQVFNRNGLGRSVRSVVPYAYGLRRLPAYLQQLEMESNGKGVDLQGRPLERSSATVVFGGEGTNVQHAYFQQMHQGTEAVPVEFIAVADGEAALNANAVAQAEALLVGRSGPGVRPEQVCPGNRPSSFILMDALTPETLGALLALYEHKTFVEGVVWGLNSFDQWGVELGKTLAGRVLAELEGDGGADHDPSTAALIARLRRR